MGDIPLCPLEICLSVYTQLTTPCIHGNLDPTQKGVGSYPQFEVGASLSVLVSVLETITHQKDNVPNIN